MKKIITSNKGFSLIELMVVVAIIGILASVAIPNFSKFQAKARQGGAKSMLAGIYTAEKAFFTEWTQYFGDFRDIGFAPEGDLLYTAGFGAVGNDSPSDVAYLSGVGADSAAVQFDTTLYIAGGGGAVENGDYVCAVAAGSVSADGAFTAEACGDVDRDGTNDVWQIDENKLLRNTTVDI